MNAPTIAHPKFTTRLPNKGSNQRGIYVRKLNDVRTAAVLCLNRVIVATVQVFFIQAPF
jgi:hypothetical protein